MQATLPRMFARLVIKEWLLASDGGHNIVATHNGIVCAFAAAIW
jgi:hypothetical protein